MARGDVTGTTQRVWYTSPMTLAPTTWTVNQRALVDVVLHRHALLLPCSIREVRKNRILVGTGRRANAVLAGAGG